MTDVRKAASNAEVEAAEPVAVKPLEWNAASAKTPFGFYRYECANGRVYLYTPIDKWGQRFADEASAINAAQADYEQRIRSALHPAPAPEGWRDIKTAPKDGTTILAWCVHAADPYHVDEKSLTAYGAHCEGLSHVEDGAHVVQWGGGSWESTDGYGSGYLIPDWWFRFGSEWEETANPIAWMPICLPTRPPVGTRIASLTAKETGNAE